MEAFDQRQADGRADGAGGIEREEHGCEIRRVGLEEILAVENAAAFGVGAPRGEEDVGGEAYGRGVRRAQLMRVSGQDGGCVGED